MRPVARRIVVAGLLAFLLASGCSDGSGRAQQTVATGTNGTTESDAIGGEIVVFAAASLTDAFEDIANAFEAGHPGTRVTMNFGGSPALRTQLQEGASGDIYAPADTDNMQQALDAGVVIDAGRIFTRNRLAVIVPAGSPAGITALQDLGNQGVQLVLATSDVPVGRYARKSIDKMHADGSFGEGFTSRTLANVVSEEPNVKAVVTKVQLGEADAAIVYVTDVTADIAGDVSVIDIPDDFNVVATYPIAVTTSAENTVGAEALIAFVLSEEGQAILENYGFQPIE